MKLYFKKSLLFLFIISLLAASANADPLNKKTEPSKKVRISIRVLPLAPSFNRKLNSGKQQRLSVEVTFRNLSGQSVNLDDFRVRTLTIVEKDKNLLFSDPAVRVPAPKKVLRPGDTVEASFILNADWYCSAKHVLTGDFFFNIAGTGKFQMYAQFDDLVSNTAEFFLEDYGPTRGFQWECFMTQGLSLGQGRQDPPHNGL